MSQRDHTTTEQYGAVPLLVRKKLERRCLWSGCHAPAKSAPDRADYCAEHHERVKAKAKKWQAKHRARLRRAKLCIDCSKPSGKTARCSGCREEASEAAADRRRVDRDARRVDSDREPKTKIEIHADGYARIRTVGRGVRGQKSRAELDDDLRQDLSDAVAQVAAVRDSGIAQLRLPQVADLGRIAKREAQAIVADRLLTAKRALEAVAEALCPGRLAELERVRREAVDEE